MFFDQKIQVLHDWKGVTRIESGGLRNDVRNDYWIARFCGA
jgi:hypothetical protein